jgi:predicted Rossmann-fold nucleotide-binding protein
MRDVSRVLVCGGRDYQDYKKLCQVLDELGPKFIISGGARGADTLAVRWAKDHGVPYTVRMAEWNVHGRAAGHIRNQAMLDLDKPTCVVAFPGGPGTRNMINRSRLADLEVLEVI